MRYFKKVKNFEDLKAQFKALAKVNHPDAGGNAETMKEINIEYDALFPIWKKKAEDQSGETINETAGSTRNEFYTQFGWEGKNHDWNRSLKEVAKIVRAYIKAKYPMYKFSVRTSYASCCEELMVEMKESPVEIYKSFDELTWEDKCDLHRELCRRGVMGDTWTDEELRAELERLWESGNSYFKVLNDVTKAVIKDVDSFVQSYNYEDCDGMIDYFEVDFYYFSCCPNNGEKVKIVPKTAKIKEVA